MKSFALWSSALNCHKFHSLSCIMRTHRAYSIVRPASLQPLRTVPKEIVRPPYIKSTFLSKIADNIFHRMTKPDIKSKDDITRMKRSCQVARKVLTVVARSIQPGITTDELDRIAHEECIANGAYPSPLLYKRFPKSICTSVNNVACHGIPDTRCLQDGDIINVDVTVFYKGFHGDTSETFLVGNVDEAGQHLVTVARHCRDEAIRACGPGRPFNIIGEIVSLIAEGGDCEVIPNFCGHGIGTYFHGPPEIIHDRNDIKGNMLEGMTFTIEPVICDGSPEIDILDDGWTAVTTDDSRTAQFEHTVLITKDGVDILTQ